MRSIAIVAACLLMAGLFCGCGKTSQPVGRNEAAPSSPAPDAAAEGAQPRASKDDSRPVIVAFGDSLTQGVSGRSYPAYLQDLLDKDGYKYRVDNQGVSGDTSTDGLARIENVIAANPALVILEFGGNDGLRGVPVDATRQNLEQMIERFEAVRIPVALAGITLPPNYGPEYVAPFTAIFPELARKHKLRFLPFLLIHVYDKPALMQPDGIHPNDEGNEIVSADVFKLIRPMLKN
jgi:acyl-CoA thioesterase I